MIRCRRSGRGEVMTTCVSRGTSCWEGSVGIRTLCIPGCGSEGRLLGFFHRGWISRGGVGGGCTIRMGLRRMGNDIRGGAFGLGLGCIYTKFTSWVRWLVHTSTLRLGAGAGSGSLARIYLHSAGWVRVIKVPLSLSISFAWRCSSRKRMSGVCCVERKS